MTRGRGEIQKIINQKVNQQKKKKTVGKSKQAKKKKEKKNIKREKSQHFSISVVQCMAQDFGAHLCFFCSSGAGKEQGLVDKSA